MVCMGMVLGKVNIPNAVWDPKCWSARGRADWTLRSSITPIFLIYFSFQNQRYHTYPFIESRAEFDSVIIPDLW